MNKLLVSAVLLGGVVVPFLANAAPATPTCTLTATPTVLQLWKSNPVHITWTSTGGAASLLVDAYTQPNIYSSTAPAGDVTIPVIGSLGTKVTLTVTGPGGSTVCAVPLSGSSTPR